MLIEMTKLGIQIVVVIIEMISVMKIINKY